ncbi:helix-turn-helix transcriptional regulator, partial [Neobacillus niacini]|uniref:helix-turn-helix transcriptional regulator n=1 Tax=Neobacillus niacini TaxID=86668 RepID=UPI002FFD8923
SNSHTGKDFSLILQYIQTNYRKVSLKSLAELFHYSEAHLSVLIKKNTGLNFNTIIKKLKMTSALDYIENTDFSIEDIAERVGYISVDHFSRTFKKYYSKSPQQYRKSIRG